MWPFQTSFRAFSHMLIGRERESTAALPQTEDNSVAGLNCSGLRREGDSAAFVSRARAPRGTLPARQPPRKRSCPSGSHCASARLQCSRVLRGFRSEAMAKFQAVAWRWFDGRKAARFAPPSSSLAIDDTARPCLVRCACPVVLARSRLPRCARAEGLRPSCLDRSPLMPSCGARRLRASSRKAMGQFHKALLAPKKFKTEMMAHVSPATRPCFPFGMIRSDLGVLSEQPEPKPEHQRQASSAPFQLRGGKHREQQQRQQRRER